jgi:hypothetical protein
MFIDLNVFLHSILAIGIFTKTLFYTAPITEIVDIIDIKEPLNISITENITIFDTSNLNIGTSIDNMNTVLNTSLNINTAESNNCNFCKQNSLRNKKLSEELNYIIEQ